VRRRRRRLPFVRGEIELFGNGFASILSSVSSPQVLRSCVTERPCVATDKDTFRSREERCCPILSGSEIYRGTL
jgi:hypothetical protein